LKALWATQEAVYGIGRDRLATPWAEEDGRKRVSNVRGSIVISPHRWSPCDVEGGKLLLRLAERLTGTTLPAARSTCWWKKCIVWVHASGVLLLG
jgi:hypothetical protein